MVEDKRARGEITNVAKEKSRLEVRRAKALEDGDAEAAETCVASLLENYVMLKQDLSCKPLTMADRLSLRQPY